MPIVKQLSIFLENKPGVLARLCQTYDFLHVTSHPRKDGTRSARIEP
jgi:hypothetical protein